MKTIISTPEVVTAEQIVARLNEADIDAQMLEDKSTFISASGDIFNYSIIVNDCDVDAANKIVSGYQAESKECTAMPWCPECGSEDVSETIIRRKRGSLFFLILAPFMLAIGFFSPNFFCWLFSVGAILFIIQYFIGYSIHRYKCNKCHHVFKRY